MEQNEIMVIEEGTEVMADVTTNNSDKIARGVKAFAGIGLVAMGAVLIYKIVKKRRAKKEVVVTPSHYDEEDFDDECVIEDVED